MCFSLLDPPLSLSLIKYTRDFCQYSDIPGVRPDPKSDTIVGSNTVLFPGMNRENKQNRRGCRVQVSAKLGLEGNLVHQGAGSVL